MKHLSSQDLVFNKPLQKRKIICKIVSPLSVLPLGKQVRLKLHCPFQSTVSALLGLWLSPQEQAKYSGTRTYKRQAAEHHYHISQLAHHSTL